MQRGQVIAAEQVGVLQDHAKVGLAGRFGAGVVGVGHHLPGRLVLDVQHGVNLVVLFAALQLHGDLLGRALVGLLEIGRHLIQVRCAAFLQRRQAAADIGFVEVSVVLDADAADPGFNHP